MKEKNLKNVVSPHPFIANSTVSDWRSMLYELKIKNILDLYSDVPGKFLLNRRLNLEHPLSKLETFNHVSTILNKNISYQELASLV